MTTPAPVSRRSALRLAATLVAATVCLGVAVVTMPEQVRRALAVESPDGPPCVATSRTAHCLVKQANVRRKQADYDSAISLARQAIVREPFNIAALEALSRSIDPRKVGEKRRLIGVIAELSKHSAYAHTVLFTEAYDGARFDELYLQADILLRWQDVVPDTVYDTLVLDMTTQAARTAAARRLASGPPWRRDFLHYVATAAEPAQALALAATMERLGVRPTPVEAEFLVDRLLDQKLYDDLRRYRSLVLSRGGPPTLVYDGAFDELEGPDTFVWKTLTLSGGKAVLGTATTDHPGTLFLQHDLFSSSDWMARQLTVLTPGRYRLSLVAQGLDEQGSRRFVIEVACRGAASILRLPIRTEGDAWVATSGDFTVPVDTCPTQWIAFSPVTGDRVEPAAILVDRISIMPSSSPEQALPAGDRAP